MKNLIIALSLFFALGASAQSKSNKTVKANSTTTTADPRTAIITSAQKSVDQLVAFTPVNAETQTALKELFITKYSMLKDAAGFSPERKTIITEAMEYRLSLLLEPATLEKLKSNATLYSSLIN